MLSERIYTFRRKNGLSQEQLAEKIGVSRQAVSKWESGASTPELEKLMALCACFHITLDELTKEEPPADDAKETKEPEKTSKTAKKAEMTVGISLCLVGAVCLILSGILSVAFPRAVEQLDAASAVTLRGSGVFLLLCVLSLIAGLVLILRKK